MNIYSLTGIPTKDIVQNSLSFLLSRLSVWIQDTTLFLNGVPGDIGTPLLSFVYNPVGEMGLLKYEYTRYPFLNKTIISNGGIKQPNEFTLEMHSVITPLQGFAVNILKMNLLVPYMDKYIAYGGLFSVATKAYIYRNVLLKELKIKQMEANNGGYTITGQFFQPLISNESLNETKLNLDAQRLQQGAVPL